MNILLHELHDEPSQMSQFLFGGIICKFAANDSLFKKGKILLSDYKKNSTSVLSLLLIS